MDEIRIKADKRVDLGGNIKSLRTAKGMNQAEMLRSLELLGSGLYREIYRRIEKNQRNVSASELLDIKEVLGASFEDLFRRE